jgi:hypothetical protein
MSCYAAREIKPFNFRRRFYQAELLLSYLFCIAERHNAAIHPPGDNCGTDKLTMKAMLNPVGCNRLLDRPPILPFNARLAWLRFDTQDPTLL